MTDREQAPFSAEKLRSKILVFCGKGGVGKTTAATAVSNHLAQHGASVLLVSFDPAHSVQDRLKGVHYESARLQTLEFNASTELESFKEKWLETIEYVAEHGTFFERQDVQELFSLSFPGMDEMLAFLYLGRAIEELNEGAYDTICIDTAPTGHLLTLLKAEETLLRWFSTFGSLLGKEEEMFARFGNRGNSAQKYQSGASIQIEQQIHDIQQTGEWLHRKAEFVLVSQAAPIVVDETIRLWLQLSEQKFIVQSCIVNDFPRHEEGCSLCHSNFVEANTEAERLMSALGADLSFFIQASGAADKGEFVENYVSHLLGPLDHSAERKSAAVQKKQVHDSRDDRVELCHRQLFLSVGKGGVGKTSWAAAIAVALAQSEAGPSVLVISTDPAHSLGDRFGVALGKKPQTLEFEFSSASVDAMEVDPAQELASLRQSLGRHIEEAFGEKLNGSSFSLRHDQEAILSLLELTPPGLDELMALLVLSDAFEQGSYDAIVVDSAPSGHLVRLLSMPEIIEDWLKTIFSILLKYKNIFSSLGLNKELFLLKRRVRALRELIQDPTRCGAIMVTRATDMCLEECRDLHKNLQKLGTAVSGLLINQVRHRDSCNICDDMFKSESQIIDAYLQEFAPLQPKVVHSIYRKDCEPKTSKECFLIEKLVDLIEIQGGHKG